LDTAERWGLMADKTGEYRADKHFRDSGQRADRHLRERKKTRPDRRLRERRKRAERHLREMGIDG
jgi:hypothetical protein